MAENVFWQQENSFIKILLGKTALPILTILGVGILYVILMSVIDHKSFPFPIIILVLALVKTLMISHNILKQLSRMIKICHSLERLLLVFGVLIGISLLSFATDYTCLYQFNQATFSGIPTYSDTYIYNLYHFFYFSMTTFSTVGYGDIVPVSEVARLVVMLEIFLSFFIIVFALANIKKIHINEQN